MADDLNSRSLLLIVAEVSSLAILNVLSLIGNSLVCILIYKDSRLRTTTNLYITALAVSDLLSAVFVMPLGIGVLITSDWIFGEVMCELEAFFVCFVAYVSPVTMGLTAINRYFRICKSEQQYKKFFSPGKSRTWLVVGGSSLPYTLWFQNWLVFKIMPSFRDTAYAPLPFPATLEK